MKSAQVLGMRLDRHKRDIVVAREEAYVCGVEGRGSFEGMYLSSDCSPCSLV